MSLHSCFAQCSKNWLASCKDIHERVPCEPGPFLFTTGGESTEMSSTRQIGTPSNGSRERSTCLDLKGMLRPPKSLGLTTNIWLPVDGGDKVTPAAMTGTSAVTSAIHLSNEPPAPDNSSSSTADIEKGPLDSDS